MRGKEQRPTDGQSPEVIAAWQRDAFEIYSRYGLLVEAARPEDIDLEMLIVFDPKTRNIAFPVAIRQELLDAQGIEALRAQCDPDNPPQFARDVMALARRMSCETAQRNIAAARHRAAEYRDEVGRSGAPGGLQLEVVEEVPDVDDFVAAVKDTAMRFAAKYGGAGPALCALTARTHGKGWRLLAFMGETLTLDCHAAELDHVVAEADVAENPSKLSALVEALCEHYAVPMHAAVIVDAPNAESAPIVDVAVVAAAYSHLDRKPLMKHGGPIQ